MTTYSPLSQVTSKRGTGKPSMESMVELLTGKGDELTSFRKRVSVGEVRDIVERAVAHLAEKVCYEARYMISQLPSNLECANTVILSGGGALIGGVKEAVEQALGLVVKIPRDPVFSDVHGFYRIDRKLFED